SDPADRTEPRHGDRDRRPAAGDGGRRDRRGDDGGAARCRSRAPAPVSRRRTGQALTMLRRLSIAALAALFVAGCGGSSSPKGPPELVFVSTKDGDYAIFGADAD